MTKKDPLVSICCITYNHEEYIRDAIDGFLMQKTSFPIEIIIHDDCSTDKTSAIIKEYWRKNPNLIYPILQKENQFSQGKQILPFAAKKAKGKYIAICEGDDYWTDPRKLQKQVNFLEKNDRFSGVAHQSIVKHENNNVKNYIFSSTAKDVIKTEDLLSGRLFHTASLAFRTKIIEKNNMPDNILSGDRCLFFLCSLYGPIKFLNETMCVYRKSSSGISSWITYDLLKKDLNMPDFLHKISPSFPRAKYLSFIHRTLFTYPKNITFRQFLKHYFFYVIYSFSTFPVNLKSVSLFTAKRIIKKTFLCGIVFYLILRLANISLDGCSLYS